MAEKGHLNATNEQIIKVLNAEPKSVFYNKLSNSDLANMQATMDSILGVSWKRNEFTQALWQVVGWTEVHVANFTNPLNFIKTGPMRYGGYMREIFVNMIEAMDYNVHDGADELLKLYRNNVMAAYHPLNYRKKWPISINYDELSNAFAEPYGLQSLILGKLSVILSSVEYWEFNAIKSLLGVAYNNGLLYPVTVVNPTDSDTSRALLKTIRSVTRKVYFPEPAYNFAGAQSSSKREDLFLLVTPEVEATLDVDALAVLFHVERAEVQTRIVVIDKFENPNIVAMLVDRRYIIFKEQLSEMGDFRNPDTLTTTFFYHRWEMLELSPFFTCVAFTTEKVSVASITIQDNLNFIPGQELNIKVEVEGEADSYIPQNVSLRITSPVTSPDTIIVPGTFTLIVGTDETAENISVEASSLYNPTITATASITKSV